MTSWEITLANGKHATVVADDMAVEAGTLRFMTDKRTVAVFYGASAAYDQGVVGFHRGKGDGLPAEAMTQP